MDFKYLSFISQRLCCHLKYELKYTFDGEIPTGGMDHADVSRGQANVTDNDIYYGTDDHSLSRE